MGIVKSEQAKGLSLKRKMTKMITYGVVTLSIFLVTVYYYGSVADYVIGRKLLMNNEPQKIWKKNTCPKLLRVTDDNHSQLQLRQPVSSPDPNRLLQKYISQALINTPACLVNLDKQ